MPPSRFEVDGILEGVAECRPGCLLLTYGLDDSRNCGINDYRISRFAKVSLTRTKLLKHADSPG